MQRRSGEYTDSGGRDTMVNDSGDDDADTTTVMARLLLRTSLGIRGFDYAGGDTKKIKEIVRKMKKSGRPGHAAACGRWRQI